MIKIYHFPHIRFLLVLNVHLPLNIHLSSLFFSLFLVELSNLGLYPSSPLSLSVMVALLIAQLNTARSHQHSRTFLCKAIAKWSNKYLSSCFFFSFLIYFFFISYSSSPLFSSLLPPLSSSSLYFSSLRLFSILLVNCPPLPFPFPSPFPCPFPFLLPSATLNPCLDSLVSFIIHSRCSSHKEYHIDLIKVDSHSSCVLSFLVIQLVLLFLDFLVVD